MFVQCVLVCCLFDSYYGYKGRFDQSATVYRQFDLESLWQELYYAGREILVWLIVIRGANVLSLEWSNLLRLVQRHRLCSPC